MVVLYIAQPPIDEIAGHAEQQGHTEEVDAFQTQRGRRTGHDENLYKQNVEYSSRSNSCRSRTNGAIIPNQFVLHAKTGYLKAALQVA